MFKIAFYQAFSLIFLLVLALSACSKRENPQNTEISQQAQQELNTAPASAQFFSQGTESTMDEDSLDRIAELERSGRYTPGLGFTESTIRERSGDYAGAVVAAYKEMAWTYALADTTIEGHLTIEQIKEGLNAVLALYSGEGSSPMQQGAHTAVTAILYFIDHNWADAEELLDTVFADDEEIDSFAQWMILTCGLEQGDAPRSVRSQYGAIRSRYEFFPEYWYHLARYLDDNTARMDAAERCILLAPRGPYAPECRALIAGIFNIEPSRSQAMLIRGEIESVIANTVSSRNTELLQTLFPLLELPDNPYTMYAIGAMRALSAASLYKDFFLLEASQSSGRLHERLIYISQG